VCSLWPSLASALSISPGLLSLALARGVCGTWAAPWAFLVVPHLFTCPHGLVGSCCLVAGPLGFPPLPLIGSLSVMHPFAWLLLRSRVGCLTLTCLLGLPSPALGLSCGFSALLRSLFRSGFRPAVWRLVKVLSAAFGSLPLRPARLSSQSFAALRLAVAVLTRLPRCICVCGRAPQARSWCPLGKCRSGCPVLLRVPWHGFSFAWFPLSPAAFWLLPLRVWVAGPRFALCWPVSCSRTLLEPAAWGGCFCSGRVSFQGVAWSGWPGSCSCTGCRAGFLTGSPLWCCAWSFGASCAVSRFWADSFCSLVPACLAGLFFVSGIRSRFCELPSSAVLGRLCSWNRFLLSGPPMLVRA